MLWAANSGLDGGHFSVFRFFLNVVKHRASFFLRPKRHSGHKRRWLARETVETNSLCQEGLEQKPDCQCSCGVKLLESWCPPEGPGECGAWSRTAPSELKGTFRATHSVQLPSLVAEAWIALGPACVFGRAIM